MSVVLMVAVLVSGQAMAYTAELILADWSEASPLGGWYNISAGVNAYSGYYYTDADTINNYLKFNLSSIAPAAGYSLVVNSATLTIYTAAQYGPTFSENVYAVAEDGWTQASVNYANKPALGSLLTTVSWPGDWSSFVIAPASLAAYIQQEGNGDGVASLGMRAGADCVMVDNMTPRHLFYMGTLESQWFVTKLVVSYSFVEDPIDFNKDGNHDLKDFAIFAKEWMVCIDPVNINCSKPWE